MRRCAGAVALVLLLLGPGALEAQQDREALIEQARLTADETSRRDLFIQAANPVEPDSLWAVAVFELAQITLLELGDDDLAAVWLRWALRHGEWEIDRAYFAPSLVELYDEVAESAPIDDEALPEGSTTTWTWPEAFSAGDAGTLVISDSEANVTVAVEGQDDVPEGSALELAPGTYELVATAEGYEPAQLTREVLPGAETIVSLELLPVLADDVAQQVALSLLSLRYTSAGALTCTNALAMRENVAITSMSGLGGATELEVPRPNTSPLVAEVLGTDPEQDLAVLHVPELDIESRPTTGLAESGFGWSVFRTGCEQNVQVARTRLDGTVPIGGVPGEAAGAPLVDRGGSLMGLVSSGGRVSAMSQVEALLEEATAQLQEGGFPVAWLVVGAAAVGGGVAAALLLGGDDPPDPTQAGTVVVPIPSN